MTKHTNGPWRFEPSTKTIRSVPENYWLATMDSWDGAVNHEANASLVAAAPDLLAAARKALDFIQSLPYESSIHPSTKAQDALVDAIAKANG